MSETMEYQPKGQREAVRNAWRGFWRTLFGSVTTYSRWCPMWGKARPDYGHIVTPFYVWLVWAIFGAPLFALEQAWGSAMLDGGWPERPFLWFSAAHNAIGGWVERRAEFFAWMPPDSGDPTEVGFHIRSELVKRERDEEGNSYYPDRPRIYVTSFGGSAIASTPEPFVFRAAPTPEG